jgi:hypothetical protein
MNSIRCKDAPFTSISVSSVMIATKTRTYSIQSDLYTDSNRERIYFNLNYTSGSTHPKEFSGIVVQILFCRPGNVAHYHLRVSNDYASVKYAVLNRIKMAFVTTCSLNEIK